ncbi:PKD domain-containing protein [Aquimarina sp. ERC-38]|uniref:PKD domain-containing protein n=1 Tax=Aquimarina sp. ERC-38 TaxID=2949996 RepID=UPI002247C162|nr:PKD domain-containing protein [Aquimarina sp. ERC-38]UZO81754.1 PKD domain-containing protein [Aquimarina sp. ERC-38]
MTTTLEAITTNFRRFTKNQVLTEGHLNQIVDYFDDQIRLSRTCLSGVGIVCGFEVSCDESTSEITITQGVGVSTDGDLMHLFRPADKSNYTIDFESITYGGYRTYDNTNADYKPFFYREETQINLLELVEESSGEGITSLSSLSGLKDRIVLLYRESYIEDADLCTTLGCDNQGESSVVNHRVLLVSKADAEYIISQDPTIQKTNYANVYYSLPEVIMNKVVATPEIFDTYTDLKQSFLDVIIADNTVQKLEEGFTKLLTALKAPSILTVVQDKLTELFGFNASSIPDDFQYRYDALKDFVDTYNEIKDILLSVETSDCCAGYKDFPKHLMLGEVEKSGPCYECRHGFYKSPILADLIATTCDSCDPIELTYDIDTGGDDDSPCVDGGSTVDIHIVFTIDGSSSFANQRDNVRNALNGYLDSVRNSNTYISFIMMTGSDNAMNPNNLIYVRATDPELRTWISNFPTSPSFDWWETGYKVVIESILETDIPNPTIVITLADELPTGNQGLSAERFKNIKKETQIFNYIVDSRSPGILDSRASGSMPANVIASIDGETDLDKTDYFLTSNFNDLETKIINLNESLINSGVLCPETTEDEVVIDQDNSELTVCYSAGKSEQRLFTLIKRAVTQLANYNADYQFIKVTLSKNLGKLSKKAIPFYYNVGEKLIEYWDFDKTIQGRHKTNLSYHDSLLAIKKPLEFCIDSDFYRVEGHLGRNYKEVVGRINTIKKSNSLGFNVVALPIENDDILGENFKSFYLNRNLGLEHKAGVPPGGTLVLFYLQTSQSNGDGGATLVSERDEIAARKKDKAVARAARVSDSDSGLEAFSFEIDPAIADPVVADFCLPYLCCDENENEISLPDEVICFDEDTQPIPFNVVPATAVVRADVPAGLDGGVIRNSDGTYSFDARRVSRQLHGTSIRFIVNNQSANFGVRVYEKPEASVTRSISYNDTKTVATVNFRVSGVDLNTITEFTWDFGDGSPLSNERPNASGQVRRSYNLPVNVSNTVFPRLTISRDFCDTDIEIESITFESTYYYYYGGDSSLEGDDTLSMSVGDL